MRENDYTELDAAVEEFESTVDSLKKIAEISENTKKTAKELEQLYTKVEAATVQLENNSSNLKLSAEAYKLQLGNAIDGLASIKEDITQSGSKSAADICEKIDNVLFELEKQSSVIVTETIPNAVKTLFKNDEKIEKSISEKLKSSAGLLKEDILKVQDGLCDNLHEVADNIDSKVENMSGNVSGKLEAEANGIKKEIASADKRIVHSLEALSNSLTKLQQELLADYDALNNQLTANKKLLIVSIVLSGAAFVSAVLGLFI